MGITLEVVLMIFEYPGYTTLLWTLFCIWSYFDAPLKLCACLIGGPLGAVFTLVGYLVMSSRLADVSTEMEEKYRDWIEIVDPNLKHWQGKKMPIRSAYEWYFRGRINFTRPTLEVFLHRYHLFRMILGWDHIREFLDGVVRKGWWNHDDAGDEGEVAPVYNLGNDYYYAFLSDPMFYSCGVAYKQDDSLEVAQHRKCGMVAEQLQLKDGDKILDFGCGWGSWLIYAASNFNVECHGLTISQCQFDYATNKIRELGLEDKITIHLIDYREMQPEKYGMFDKITCFEMSEHVGIRNYQNYVAQVRSLLVDDGLFFLQIAGLRRAWNYEDLIWGVFMGKYIFPGADASCPLYWDVNQLERGGMEVHMVRNQGVHYAHTIEAWYHNIVKNKDQVIDTYDQFAYRRHELFLAWSTMVARQGSSTVYTILATHNHKLDARTQVEGNVKLNRSAKFINRSSGMYQSEF